jgi:hypothetical protein
MKPLKFGSSMLFFLMILLSFHHIIHCTSMSSNCMSLTTMVMTLQYAALYTWHTIVVHAWTRLTWSNIIYAFSRSCPICMRLTRSTPLLGPSSNILKKRTCFFPCHEKTLPWMNSIEEGLFIAVMVSMTPPRAAPKR